MNFVLKIINYSGVGWEEGGLMDIKFYVAFPVFKDRPCKKILYGGRRALIITCILPPNLALPYLEPCLSSGASLSCKPPPTLSNSTSYLLEGISPQVSLLFPPEIPFPEPKAFNTEKRVSHIQFLCIIDFPHKRSLKL